MSNFRVGQRVCCIEGDDYAITVEGKIYTVAKVIPRGRNEADGTLGPGIQLHEVAPPSSHQGFDVRRFRPVVERKTDISQFRAMLNPKKIEVTA